MGVYEVADEAWDAYVTKRLTELAQGSVAPREWHLADGRTLEYSACRYPMAGGCSPIST